MLKCKICGKNLYKDITFSIMFRFNYDIHLDCISNLKFNKDESMIPIESNIIIYDYVFESLGEKYNKEYLWCEYFGKLIDKYILSNEWSIVIILDRYIEFFIINYNPYLLLNLSSKKILLLSLDERLTTYLEGL